METIQERNKRIVTEFYDLLINRKDFDAARRHLGASYVQHNPHVVDGLDGLRRHVENIRRDYPQAHSTLKRIFAEGDFVIAHVHAVRVPGTPGKAIVDIFRFEGDKIVEHWDVIQEIPAQPSNANSMF